MKRILLLLAVLAVALPAFADSITFYGSQAGGPYMGGGATFWTWEHPTGNPAWGTFDGGGALSNGGTFAFNVTGWTGSSTNNIFDYTGGSLSVNWRGTALSGSLSNVVFNSSTGLLTAAFNGYDNSRSMSGSYTQQLNIVSGGNINGYFYTYGNVGRGNVATPVPEPETLGLLGTGLFVIGGLVRRKLKVENLSASADASTSEGGVYARERNFRSRTAPRRRTWGTEREQTVMTHGFSPRNQSSTAAGGVPRFISPTSDDAIAPEVEAL